MSTENGAELQGNILRLGAWPIELTSFFFRKIIKIVLQNQKLSKLCFIVEKIFRSLGLHLVVK